MFSVDCGKEGFHWLSPSVSMVMMNFILSDRAASSRGDEQVLHVRHQHVADERGARDQADTFFASSRVTSLLTYKSSRTGRKPASAMCRRRLRTVTSSGAWNTPRLAGLPCPAPRSFSPGCHMKCAAAPLLGEHSNYVLKELLGMTDDDFKKTHAGRRRAGEDR
jgi:hypothetical protein